jgi:3-phytase
VSDQGGNEFHVFPREGSGNNAHDHPLIKVVALNTLDSDGSDVTSLALNADFPGGMFVAMSNDKTFQIYSWADAFGLD